MTDTTKPVKANVAVPGMGFVFKEGGMSFKEAARWAYQEGYLSDEEMREGDGVPAFRRILYDEFQGIPHYKRNVDRSTIDWEAHRERERLRCEVNAYADALGVNDPAFMKMIVTADDLDAFDLAITGVNLVDAELAITIKTRNPTGFEKLKASNQTRIMRIVAMVEWILAGRPEQE
jgi:hypothetical protein